MPIDLDSPGSIRHIQTVVENLQEGDRFWWTMEDCYKRDPIVVRAITAVVQTNTGLAQPRLLHIKINGQHVALPGTSCIIRIENP